MYSKVFILGNCGREPEQRYTPAGKAVCNFSVASNRSFKGKDGEWQSEVTWYRVTTWNDLAERCNEKLHKGSTVFIEGRLNPDENGNPAIWTDKDGNPRTSYEVTARDVRFLDSRGEGSPELQKPVADDGIPDDIPF